MRSKPPKLIDVSIESIGSDGIGVAKVENRTVRVKNALPGESVSARVLRSRKGEWLSEALEVSRPARLRVDPPCSYYPRCGGCAMQHLAYDSQIELKQQRLLDELSAVGVQPLVVDPATLGPRLNYRTKARFGVRLVDGQVLVGFRESFSSRVSRMDGCLTLVAPVARLLAPLQRLIAALSCPDRIPQVEVAAGDGSSALIFRHLEAFTEPDQQLIEEFAHTHQVKCFGQSGSVATVRPLSASARMPYLGYGNPDYGLHFQFFPTDFTQVNLAMNRMLVNAAVNAFKAGPGERVLDLFCGIGNFSLALAASGLQVEGLESAASAIDRARENALRNRLDGWCEFAVRDLYDPACQDLGRAPYILMDPPRSGAGPNLQRWVQLGATERVVYVSCSPTSFAADASVLVREGFELERVGLFDMFPHTAHVETLGVFARRW